MFLKYITLISGFNYLLFSVVLLLKRTQIRKENLILGFLFFIMAAYNLLLSFYNSALLENDYATLAYYIPVDCILASLMGPLMYFYIKTLLNSSFTLKSKIAWLHVLPVLPAVIFNIYFTFLPKMVRIDLLLLNFEKGIWLFDLLDVLFYIQMTIYLFICYRIIQKQLKISSKILKGSNQVDISWLNTLIIIDLIVMFGSVPLCFYIANEKTSLIIAQLAMDIQLVYIFFKSTWQTGVFPSENVAEVKFKEPVLKIADEVAEDYFRDLIVFMEEKKPYLLDDCNIQFISEQTNICVHHLSNILNQRIDKNFSDFVNEYRINEAKKILRSSLYKKMTLEAIGCECGFGSKSSFNKAFKKLTNFTPSEYRLLSE